MKTDNVIGRRLREARELTAYSQRQLGLAAGFDQFSASSRVNHYEQGRHQPNFSTVQKFSELLSIPTAYLYAEEDDLAELILTYSRLDKNNRQEALNAIREK